MPPPPRAPITVALVDDYDVDKRNRDRCARGRRHIGEITSL